MTKLEEMLKYVSEHNDFYKNRIKEYGITNPLDITQWPILTRKEVQKNRYNMFSDGYRSKYLNQQLHRQSSSGSSGMPINVYWDYKDWHASNMSLWRKRCQWYNIKPQNKQVVFTLNAFHVKYDSNTVYYTTQPSNRLFINISLIHSEEGYKKIVEIINDFNPEWLYIQPFVLNKLIQVYKKYEIKKPTLLKYIESVGELLSSELRKSAIEFFNVPLANMYGSEEMNGIAFECPSHHLHILDDNVYLEMQNKNQLFSTGKGEAIITNLHNYAMPLIRYNQTDEVVTEKVFNHCLYGGSCFTIPIIAGRKVDSIVIQNMEITPYFLLEIMADVINQFNDTIIGYRYVYIKSVNKLICMIELSERKLEWFLSVKQAIKTIFLEKTHFHKKLDFEVKLQNGMNCCNKKETILKVVE